MNIDLSDVNIGSESELIARAESVISAYNLLTMLVYRWILKTFPDFKDRTKDAWPKIEFVNGMIHYECVWEREIKEKERWKDGCRIPWPVTERRCGALLYDDLRKYVG